MANLKTDYKDDVLDVSVNEKRRWIITENGDGTVTIEDATLYSQKGDIFGSKELNKITLAVNECFQSVSDGKALVASAITDKKVPTDATATFAKMAANIRKIVLGSGNATKADVLSGKTFTNDDGVKYTGEMIDLEENATVTYSETNSAKVILASTQVATSVCSDGRLRLILKAAKSGFLKSGAFVGLAASTIASSIGLTADKLIKGNSILGVEGSIPNNGAVSKTITPTKSAQSYTIGEGYHDGTGKVSVAAIPSTYKEAKTGTFTVTVNKSTAGIGDDPQSYSLSFGKTFASTPTVVVQTVSNTNAFVVAVSSITTTGCIVKLRSRISNEDQEGSFRWIAVV